MKRIFQKSKKQNSVEDEIRDLIKDNSESLEKINSDHQSVSINISPKNIHVSENIEIKHTPNNFHKVDHLLIWRNRSPKMPSLQLLKGILDSNKKNRSYEIVLLKENNDEEFFPDFLTYVCTQNNVGSSNLYFSRNIICCLNPEENNIMPLSCKYQWPKSKLILIFTKDISVDESMLSNADCVISAKDVFKNISSKSSDIRLHLTANSFGEIIGCINQFISIILERDDNYFLSLINRKSYDSLNFEQHIDTDLLIMLKKEKIQNASDHKNMEDYFASLANNLDDLLINSKFIYPSETLLSLKDPLKTIKSFALHGARIEIMETIN